MEHSDSPPLLSDEALEGLEFDDIEMGGDFLTSAYDLATYVEALRYARSTWPEKWENPTLASYLRGLVESLERAWPGNFEEFDEEEKANLTWRGVARLLFAGVGEVEDC